MELTGFDPNITSEISILSHFNYTQPWISPFMTTSFLSKKQRKQFSLIFGALLLLILSIAYPQNEQALVGQIVGVHDGDTVTLLTEDKQNIKIRLSQIDAPESKQPYGSASKKMLSDMIFERKVSVLQEDIDRYGRIVGTVYLADTDINREMVRQGGAWVYDQYAYDPILFEYQKEAQDFNRGLWALPIHDQVKPWDWRKQKRQKIAE